jgi:ligand-binding SRPBCC domain-containing protein
MEPRRRHTVTTHVLERFQLVPRPRAEVFAFFADARNLEAITPAFLHFEIVPPVPVELRTGTLIEYRLSLFGVPFRWRTRIEEWEPGRRFVDLQLRGPYALWHHTHAFEDAEGGTRMTDRVRYRLPLGPLGAVAHPVFVRGTLERIFDFRRDRVARLLGSEGGSTRAA